MTRAAFLLLALLALGGCERTFRDMYDQPRYKPLATSSLWPDGRASRDPVDGTVARSGGTFAGTTSGRLGALSPEPSIEPLDTVRDTLRTNASGERKAAASIRMPTPTPALLARGRERFDIFCSPCHSIAGDGDGMVARRGFPHPPSFHTDEMRAASDQHFYAVITQGYGAMYSYATRIEPEDRLAIIAYIRALQLSQHATVTALDPAQQARLGALPDAASQSQEPPR
ncbi:MAG TPA: cytochrome c [Casimicrobiaceae bacterium]|nr:cytochrome c [Casimicrobiaceae bacterium]